MHMKIFFIDLPTPDNDTNSMEDPDIFIIGKLTSNDSLVRSVLPYLPSPVIISTVPPIGAVLYLVLPGIVLCLIIFAYHKKQVMAGV